MQLLALYGDSLLFDLHEFGILHLGRFKVFLLVADDPVFLWFRLFWWFLTGLRTVGSPVARAVLLVAYAKQ